MIAFKFNGNAARTLAFERPPAVERGVIRTSNIDVMPTYRVRVQCTNLLMQVEPEPPQRYGFYVNWVVDAADVHEAARIAVASVVAEPKFQRAKMNAADDPPSCWAEDVAAMPGEPIPPKQQGFVFFPEEPEDEIANPPYN